MAKQQAIMSWRAAKDAAASAASTQAALSAVADVATCDQIQASVKGQAAHAALAKQRILAARHAKQATRGLQQREAEARQKATQMAADHRFKARQAANKVAIAAYNRVRLAARQVEDDRQVGTRTIGCMAWWLLTAYDVFCRLS